MSASSGLAAFLRAGAQRDGSAAPRRGAVAEAAVVAWDAILAAAVLVWLLPIIVVICVAIRLESRGPVFFSQTRVGRNGKPFRMRKFRKFHATEGTGGLGLTLQNDPRCTRVGRFLERTKLDELPQLWNVATGDMALVGPRPETPRFAACFGNGYEKVLDYRPGIFGPSQVMFRNEAALYEGGGDPEQLYRDVVFPAKARLDLDYYGRRTVRADLMWILRGTLAVLLGARVVRMDPRVLDEVGRHRARGGSLPRGGERGIAA